MYRITATQDFMDMLQELPIKHLSVLMNSFIHIEKIEDKSIPEDNTFMEDLMAQIRNQELE